MIQVAVIVLTYNSQSTVLETLESIKRQTYQNIELIISDDCSKDDTIKTVESWLEENEKCFSRSVLLTTKENGGICTNCNRAVQESESDYYKIIAGDDYLTDDAIEHYAQYADDRSIVVSCIQLFQDSGKEELLQSVIRVREQIEDFLRQNPKDKKVYHKMLIDNIIPAVGTGFYKKEIWEKVGGYDEKYPLMEDYPFYIKLLDEGYHILFLDKKLAYYRVNMSSVCNSENTKSKFFQCKKDFYFNERRKRLKKEKMFIQLLLQDIRFRK